ncbi:MAG: GntR family transcriptional regulator [Saprospiraceae bacterium]|nr:GntR family transcriptional regulator [Saprospiraceae bacterium]
MVQNVEKIMNSQDYIEINDDSKIPKYKQIINSITKGIRDKHLNIGDKILSINHLSTRYNLSRDTVKKAYKYLVSQNIISSVQGKGFYIAKTDISTQRNVLFIINKLSRYKMQIFNAFVESMIGTNTNVDLEIYYCDPAIFKNILTTSKLRYDYYVVMPHFKDENSKYISCPLDVLKEIQNIPSEKLIILDRDIEKITEGPGKIYQDFSSDIYNALTSAIGIIKKYKKVILIFPDKNLYPYPNEIVKGFKRFCEENQLDFEILTRIYESMDLQTKDLYILIQEEDLINLINQIRASQLDLGEEIGIISYNDTPLKALLGITVVSTDFKKLGVLAAEMILNKSFHSIKNDFNFVNRFSA